MSSINSVGSGQDLYRFLQSIRSSYGSSQAGGGIDSDGDGCCGHCADGGQSYGGLFKQIETVVTDALNAAKSDPSSDPNQVIQNAITQFFQDNGLTAPGSDATGNANSDPDHDGDTDAAGQADNDGATIQAFFQLLQSLGVDPQQFRQDFLAAIQDAQNGQVDPNTAFQSFPPGGQFNSQA